MNIYKKTKNGGPVKTDKDFTPETDLKGLNYICFVLSMFLNMVILYPTKLHKFFSYSRFAVRHTEKYIIITDMY